MALTGAAKNKIQNQEKTEKFEKTAKHKRKCKKKCSKTYTEFAIFRCTKIHEFYI
jgi:hypothetical protein